MLQYTISSPFVKKSLAGFNFNWTPLRRLLMLLLYVQLIKKTKVMKV